MAVQSLKAILTTLTNFITSFVNNTNNPTGVTAAQIGAYTKSEIDTLLAAKLGLGDTPISYWGQSLSTPVQVQVIGTMLSISTPMPALLGGVRAVVMPQDLNVSGLNGQVTYIYLIATNGQLVYAATINPVPDDNVTMYLGKTTGKGADAALTELAPVIRLGNCRLSNTRRGSAIPVSDANGNISW